jgi:hypothetical protein
VVVVLGVLILVGALVFSAKQQGQDFASQAAGVAEPAEKVGQRI